MQKLCRTYCVLNNKYTVKFSNSSIKPSNQYTCNYFIVSLRYMQLFAATQGVVVVWQVVCLSVRSSLSVPDIQVS